MRASPDGAAPPANGSPATPSAIVVAATCGGCRSRRPRAIRPPPGSPA
jgi:hypothetical protein